MLFDKKWAIPSTPYIFITVIQYTINREQRKNRQLTFMQIVARGYYMAKEKFQMPQSTAGLIRYFEQSEESIKIAPEHVVIICIALIIFTLGLRFLF